MKGEVFKFHARHIRGANIILRKFFPSDRVINIQDGGHDGYSVFVHTTDERVKAIRKATSGLGRIYIDGENVGSVHDDEIGVP